MNSDQEALSRPIGGVGNPSPGNSCQRPQDLIGCICAALAGEGCYWGDVSQPLLLPLRGSTIMVSLWSFIPLFLCLLVHLIPQCYSVHISIHPSNHPPMPLSNTLLSVNIPLSFPSCMCLSWCLQSFLYPSRPQRIDSEDGPKSPSLVKGTQWNS